MLLSCPLCSKPHFEGVDSLRTSLISVATSPITCPVCQETLMGLDKLTIHLFGHVSDNNSGNVREEVGVVGSRIDSEEVSVGIGSEEVSGCSLDVKQEVDKNVERICSRTTITENKEKPPPYEISAELPGVLSPQPLKDETAELINCDICSFSFTDRNILEMHQKLLHQTLPDKRTGQYSYHCHLCSKRFRMRGSLMVHLRVAHYGFSNHIELPQHLTNNQDSSPDNTSMELENGGSKSQNKTQDCKQWSCDVCAKMFTTKYFLKKHKRLHTGEMPYSCNICNKSFTFQQSYHKHMLYHSSEKPYVCNECGRAFKEHSTLQNHARIHSGERPFGCEICDKRFRQRVSYLVHMRIHTGVMPYKCTACEKSFRYKVSQRSHKCPMNPPGSVVRIVTEAAAENVQQNLPATISTPNDSKVTLGTGKNHEANTVILPKSPDTTLAHNNNKIQRFSVETNVPQGMSTGPKCIMSVDYDTGSINLIPGNTTRTNAAGIPVIACQEALISAKSHGLSDVCSNNFKSHISKQEGYLNGMLHCEDTISNQRDIYSIVMSPILSEVESLCLNNNSPVSQPASPIEENIQEIREKCLAELFNQ